MRPADETRADRRPLLVLALAAAGCGKVSEVREPDVFAGEGIKPAPAADRTAPTGSGSIRIAVVTHGAAASAFWAIVKNGVDAAARQMTVSVSYRSPDTFNVDRMKELIYEAVDSQPDGLVVSIPDPSIAPAIRRAERAGIPVVSINSGANLWREPRRARARRPARDARGLPGRQAHGGRRRQARAVRQAGAAQQRARPALRRLRARDARGRRRARATSSSTSPTATSPRAKLRAELAARKADGVLTLSSDAARTSLEAKKEGGRATRPKLATFDLSPEILAGGQGRAHALRGRPAGLPAGLHADRDADPADPLRPLPLDGADRARRARTSSPRTTPQLALQTSARGIR